MPTKKKIKYWRIFDKGIPYHNPIRKRPYRDDRLYNFLLTHKKITADDIHNMGFNSIQSKINIINKGGKFLLTKINYDTWYVKNIIQETKKEKSNKEETDR